MTDIAEMTDTELNSYREILKVLEWREQECDHWVSPYGIRVTLAQAVAIVLASGKVEQQRQCDLSKHLEKHLVEAEAKAWESLARDKFEMFGYWAAIWVYLNRIGGFKSANPWVNLVRIARAHERAHERAQPAQRPRPSSPVCHYSGLPFSGRPE